MRKQISKLPNTYELPWLIIGDLNEKLFHIKEILLGMSSSTSYS